ncbi:MAG: hypothetical protein IJ419_09720 [Agathobacter sp.]|nr:hypothetical protein [Agathobacter sp.]
MIRREDIIADMHTHTIVSKHAYSTVKENMDVAKSRGMKYIGITEHYFNDGTDIERKNEVVRAVYGNRINRLAEGVQIVSSFEFNINQPWYDEERMSALKWRPIGLHSWFIDFETLTLDRLYDLFVESHERYGINVFVHIEREIHKLNHGAHTTLDGEVRNFYQRLVSYAKQHNIILEVNESSMVVNEGNAADRLRYWLPIAKELGVMISLGSDAHYCNEVADFRYSLELLNQLDYPKELVVNCNEEFIQYFL